MRRNVRGASHLRGEMFVIRNVRGVKCPRDECHGESYDGVSGPISEIMYGLAEILLLLLLFKLFISVLVEYCFGILRK